MTSAVSTPQTLSSGGLDRVNEQHLAQHHNGQTPVPMSESKGIPAIDVLSKEKIRANERFIPLTTNALVDRLTIDRAWPAGDAKTARRFFRYLEHWRRQLHSARLQALLKAYEPFSPDSDLLITRKYTPDERQALKKRVVDGVVRILEQANYERIDTKDVELILTKESHYGLDLQVDFSAFDDCLVFYRGASKKRDQRRNYRKFLRKEEFDVPIFQRLVLLFKLKPFDARVREVMEEKKVDRSEAERIVKRARTLMSNELKDDNIYLKLFKNIPRSDVEMVFPNTRVKFRLFDKIKLGLSGGGAFGMGVFGTAGKIAAGGFAATNPIALAGAVAGLGGIAFRQGINFMNQKQRYMVVMAQNLYFHSMADNRGVLIKLSERAAEEDVKEEMLLYSVLAKEKARRDDLPAIDAAIEDYLKASFGVSVNFDLEDALGRLIEDDLVVEESDGTLHTLAPQAAAQHIDAKWDVFLDNLIDAGPSEGREFEGSQEPPKA